MHKHLLITLVFSFFLHFGYGQWTAVETGLGIDSAQAVYSISIVDEQTIWASTFNINYAGSKFALSTDGGQSWTVGPIDNDTTTALKIQGLDEQVAWVSTLYVLHPFDRTEDVSLMYRTQDAGQSWEAVTLPVEFPGLETYYDFHFFDRDTGLVFTSISSSFQQIPMGIYRTTDGGQHWEKIATELIGRENRWFWSGNNGFEVRGDSLWIGTRGGNIVRTTDQGRTWEVFRTEFQFDSPAAQGYFVSSIAFENEQDGLALITTEPSLDRDDRTSPVAGYRTSDGGASWSRIKDFPDRLETIEYVEGSGGVYVGTIGYSSYLFYYFPLDYVISRDRGAHWQRVTSPNIATVQFTDSGDGWAGGDLSLGGLFQYGGGNLTYDDTFGDDLFFQPLAAEALPAHHVIQDLSILDEQTLWAVTYINDPDRDFVSLEDIPYQIIKSEDGGRSWELIDLPFVTGIVIPEIHAVNDQVIWCSSNDSRAFFSTPGTLYRTTDGGANWTPMFIDNAAIHWLHFFDEHSGFCMWKEDFATTTDGGETWTRGTFDFLEDERPMDGSIFKLKWYPATMATAGDNLWFGTTAGRIFKSADRGKTWEAFDNNIDPFAVINSMAFKDSLNGIYINYIGTAGRPLWGGFHMGRTTDGGKTWERLPDIHPRYYFEEIVYVPGSENGYVITNSEENLAAYTNDGGDTWQIMPDFRSFARLQFHDTQTGWAVNVHERDSLEPLIYTWQGPAFTALNTSAASPREELADFSILSNPFQHTIDVKLGGELTRADFYLSLWNAEGKEMLRRKYERSSGPLLEIEAANLPPGIYFLRYVNGEFAITRKLVKQ